MRIVPVLALALWLAAGAAPAAAQGSGTHCLKLGATTVFAPRGEVYVSVEADCKEGDFVRVERRAPKSRQTFAFENLDLVKDQVLLIRLTSSGEIVATTRSQ